MRRSLLLAASALTLVSAAARSAETLNYSYDGRGRLVRVDRVGGANYGVATAYCYDAADNRTSKSVGSSGTCSGGGGGVSFSISSNGPVTEGANSVFTITKSGTTSSSLSVSYQTANGTAVAPGDYTAKALTALTFLASDVSKTINVATATDALGEGSETFTMALSAPSAGTTIATGSATATINDPTCGGVSFKISSNGAVTEGASSVFTITKTGTASGSCDVSYATANGTATAPGDYTAKALTALTFTSAQTSKTVSVTTIDDAAAESAETFSMSLSAPTGGATLGTPSSATATINDNDSSGGVCSGVSFSVSNASAVEGDNLDFTISKAGSASTSCSVSYATADGTAVAPGDYVAKALTVLTFTSTQTAQHVLVLTQSNAPLPEPDETMSLNLSAASAGGSISDASGVGTIIDDGASGSCPTCRTSGTTSAAPAPDASTTEAPAADPAATAAPAEATDVISPPAESATPPAEPTAADSVPPAETQPAPAPDESVSQQPAVTAPEPPPQGR